MKASWVPILGILGHMIVNWDTKKKKKRRCLAWKFINLPLTQKPLGVESWNLYTMCLLRNDLRKPSLEAPGHVNKMLLAKNRQKVDDFKSIYLSKYRYWWKMISDFWIHYQSPFFSGYGRLPQPQNLKIWGLKLGFPSQRRRPKLKLFDCLC